MLGFKNKKRDGKKNRSPWGLFLKLFFILVGLVAKIVYTPLKYAMLGVILFSLSVLRLTKRLTTRDLGEAANRKIREEAEIFFETELEKQKATFTPLGGTTGDGTLTATLGRRQFVKPQKQALPPKTSTPQAYIVDPVIMRHFASFSQPVRG